MGAPLREAEDIGMKKPILGMAIILASACAVSAQQASVTPSTQRSSENVAAPFSDTSAAHVSLLDTAISESRSSGPATPPASEAAPTPAAPAPKPNFILRKSRLITAGSWQSVSGFTASSQTSSTPVWLGPTPRLATSRIVGSPSRATSLPVSLPPLMSTSM